MKLSELLRILRKDYLDDYSGMLDGSPDSVWSPDTLTRYLSTAEERYARRGWVLEDTTTSAVCDVPLVASNQDYALHSSILHVLSVRPADSELDLEHASYETISMRPRVDPATPWGMSYAYTSSLGRPQLWSTDRLNRKLRVYPTPRAEDVTAIGELNLRVVRLPLASLIPTEAVPDPEPEIPEEYHLSLLDYAAGRALLHANIDAGSRSGVRQAAKEFLGLFEAAVKEAFVERARLARGPAAVRYGGWGKREA